jgi:hypothetical protein
MKKLFFFIAILLFFGNTLFAQVGINSNNSSPDPSAMLDVQSTTQGILIPRMTSALRAAIASPVNGLMVYQTDGVSGVYYYNGNIWQRIGETDGSETKVTAGANVTVTGTGTLVSPYVINASGGGSGGHYIGELYQGGIVVAVWKVAGVEKGLIASLANMHTSGAAYTMAWSGNYETLIGPTAQSPRNGQANTTAIITQSAGGNTANKAATVCDAYTNTETGTGVYSDWYLPAVWELNQCYNAAIVVNAIVGDSNGFQNTYYWSSTEDDDNGGAWIYYFGSGGTSSSYKGNSCWVRAVRTF